MPGTELQFLDATRAAPLRQGSSGFYFCRPDGSVDENAVYDRVVRIVCEQFAVPRSTIGPDTHYINDLNMD